MLVIVPKGTMPMPAEPSPSSAPGAVLVVENDPTVRTALRLLLEEEGYPVRLAANGHQALALLRAATPAVVLVDLDVPVGREWHCEVSHRTLQGTLPVVVMRAPDSAVPDAQRRGVARWLSKPFQLADVLRAVRAVAPRAAGL
jgi:CheY-like chemotaxis protein